MELNVKKQIHVIIIIKKIDCSSNYDNNVNIIFFLFHIKI